MDLTDIAKWLVYYMVGCVLFPDKLNMGTEPTPAEFLAMADWSDIKAISDVCRLLAEEGDTKDVRRQTRLIIVEAARLVDFDEQTSDTNEIESIDEWNESMRRADEPSE